MNVLATLSALCFFIGNVLIVYYMNEQRKTNNDGSSSSTRKSFMDFDPETIESRFEERLAGSNILTVGRLMNVVGWMLLCAPVIHLAWILSHKGNNRMGLHLTIGLLALMGSFTEWIARFLSFGQTMAIRTMVNEEWNLSNWIPEDPEQNDGTGWQALEMSFIVTHGLVWYVEAIEFIILAAMMLFLAWSMSGFKAIERPLGERTFGNLFICWTVVVSLLALTDFILQVLVFVNVTRGPLLKFSYLVAIISRGLLLPVWLIILGCKLPAAQQQLQTFQRNRGEARSLS